MPIAIGTTNNENDSFTAPRYSVIPADRLCQNVIASTGCVKNTGCETKKPKACSTVIARSGSDVAIWGVEMGNDCFQRRRRML